MEKTAEVDTDKGKKDGFSSPNQKSVHVACYPAASGTAGIPILGLFVFRPVFS